ncbi:protein phosphatase 1, regulatory subunit 3Da [Leucoraja erinacea]|uniref:protein phosphatase 1, regulatory subunit 3Da n=1 Tax=Leucoraja erinaceus TaxID=7782 RepID=UPI0024567697|nr:protein phosphatase 1, regulatory subunit 3Da [Leucoraja erinacea]
MAAASQSLGEAGAVQGRPPQAPEARAGPGNRCMGFRNQIQQVLGWKKGVKQLSAAGESRPGQPGQDRGVGSELGTQPGSGNTRLEQGAQFVPVKCVGSESGIQLALDKVVRPGKSQMVVVGNSELEQRIKPAGLNLISPSSKEQIVVSTLEKVSSVLELGKRITQVTQSALGKDGGSGQVTQYTKRESVGLRHVVGKGVGVGQNTQSREGVDVGHITQFTMGNGVGLGQITQSTKGESAGLGQITQSTKGEGVGVGQISQSTMGKGVGLGRSTQSTEGEGVGLQQVTQSTEGEGVGLGQGTNLTAMGKSGGLKCITQSIQYTLSEIDNSKHLTQFTMGERGSLEQVTQFSLPDDLNQVLQPVLSKSNGLEQIPQCAHGKKSGSEKVNQCTLGKKGELNQDNQSVDSSGPEKQNQFSVNDQESEKDIGHAQVNGIVPELTNPMTNGMKPAFDPSIESAVQLKLESEEEAHVEGMSFQPVQPKSSFMYRTTKSMEQIKPTVCQDAKSAWGKRLEQCVHVPSSDSRTFKQQMKFFKCQDVESLDPTQKAELEQQIFITLTQNRSYISGLCDSVHLADGLSSQNDLHSAQDGSHLGPGKRDWLLQPTVRKRAKSCPGSPEERRGSNRSDGSSRVRFADSLGLELTEVRNFDSSVEPTVPSHVLASYSATDPTEHVIWVQRFKMEFTNPKDDENFSERLNSQKVCLEALTESELVISGTILVINLAYHKEVTVRYTCTDWSLFTDVSALFESNVDGKMDRFTFSLNPTTHMLPAATCLQFAIKYSVDGVEFWDNNNGINYKMTYQSLQVTVSVPDDNKDETVGLN